jgi:DNA-directed RNA polymerase specialized sigma24 family protein
MRARWEGLHAALIGSVTTLEMNLQFDHARTNTPELSMFPTAVSVLEFLIGEPERAEEKNALYAALVRAVQARASWASLATSILWCGLWPGLDAVYRRQLGYFLRDPEELISLISIEFTALVNELDLHSVRRIAATLVRSTEREVGRARQRQLAIAARTEPLPAIPHDRSADGLQEGAAGGTVATGDSFAANRDLLGISTGLSIGSQAADVHRWLRAEVGDDADIFLAIAVFDEDPREVAKQHGLSHAALRKRIQRIRTRLARTLSQLGPEIGISDGCGSSATGKT